MGQEAFEKARNVICAAPVLTHFDPKRELLLECDASPHGVGAVLFHRINGDNRPIGFRSRTLTVAERKYSQIEREALALVYGVTRFRDYLLGREFTLVPDHRPLLGIVGADRQTPAMAAARIQRWALLLGAYKYKLLFKPGKLMLNSDALSRLPQCLQAPEPAVEEWEDLVLALDEWDQPAVSQQELKALTAADKTLSTVCRYVIEGWPSRQPVSNEALVEYHKRRHELSVEEGLLFWGHRVVIPKDARGRLLQLLHEAHQAVATMKTVARSSFWWPGLDQAIQRVGVGVAAVYKLYPCRRDRNL